MTATATSPRVDYQTHPSRYQHVKLGFDGAVATLSLAINEDAGIRPGHVGNHYCYLLEEEGMLFAGDHIMNGSTVVLPMRPKTAARVKRVMSPVTVKVPKAPEPLA